jgi:adenylate cyclase
LALGFLQLERWCFGAALNHIDRAVEISPANPLNKANLGVIFTRIGREERLQHMRGARRIEPYFGPSWYRPVQGVAQFVMRRYAEALAEFDRGVTAEAGTSAMMAGCWAKLGLAERTRDLVVHRLAIQPRATIGDFVTRAPFV